MNDGTPRQVDRMATVSPPIIVGAVAAIAVTMQLIRSQGCHTVSTDDRFTVPGVKFDAVVRMQRLMDTSDQYNPNFVLFVPVVRILLDRGYDFQRNWLFGYAF